MRRRVLMTVDPAGTGTDETTYTITKTRERPRVPVRRGRLCSRHRSLAFRLECAHRDTRGGAPALPPAWGVVLKVRWDVSLKIHGEGAKGKQSQNSMGSKLTH